jgi:heavy metal translocating P-type ATPase
MPGTSAPPPTDNQTRLDRPFIAAVAGLGIGFYGLLCIWPGTASWRSLALLPTLALGVFPLGADIAKRLLAGELRADMLALVSFGAALALAQWLVAAILVLMLSGGEALEGLASRRAFRVLDAMARRMPQTAHRVTSSGVEDVPVAEIIPGDVLSVHPHEISPVDGVVVSGRGSMDESFLTGEPYRMGKSVGSSTLSGAVNGESVLTIRASKHAKDSRYSAIMKVMEESIQNKPRMRRLADSIAVWYAPLAIVVAATAWAAGGGSERFLAVVVSATPCPLIIAVPVAVIGAVSLAASRSIVVRDPAVLEGIGGCRTAIFDKTGTLTYGKPILTELIPAPAWTRLEALSVAAGLERYSRHPLARSILDAADREGAPTLEAEEIHETPGEGLLGVVGGREIRITGRRQAEARGIQLPPTQGGLECVLTEDGAFAALLRFRDAPREESRPFLSHLPRRHRFEKLMIVSGDRESEVRYLANAVGVSDIRAQASPEDKVAIVSSEEKRGPVLFVGDGINDAPALLHASVGVAIGSADVTAAAAGAVILTPDLVKVDELLHIGRRMRTIALESAVGGVVLSLAAMLAAAWGHLSPVEGAIAQEVIDLAAILNSARAACPGRLTDFRTASAAAAS